jgi:pimeloyl-ACP methyl ester carboxylesterase
MKKNMSKLISLALAIILVFGICVPAFASDSIPERTAPVIYVPGVNTSIIYANAGTADETEIFPPSEDGIKSAVKVIAPKLLELAALHDWNSFGDTVVAEENKLLGATACDNNGNPIGNSGIDWRYPSDDTIISSSETAFRYDWRLDPMQIAEQLSNYIDHVLAVTGASQVALRAHSMGGVIVLTYFSQHGYSKVCGTIFDTTAINGTTVCGKPLSGQINFYGDSLCLYLEDVLGNSGNKEVVDAMLTALYKLGVFDGLGKLGDNIVENLKSRMYMQSIGIIFATMPGMWALVSEEDFQAVKDYYFTGKEDEYAGLIEKINKYDSTVRQHRYELLKETASKMNIGVFTRYNFAGGSVMPTSRNLSDGIIDTKYSSFGATCALTTETLGDGYVQKISDGHNHLSCDGVIDASTCLFPEYTWFIKDLQHSDRNDNISELETLILFSHEQFTVNSSSRWPQFLCNRDGGIYPLSDSDANRTLDMSWDKIFKILIEYLFSLIKNVIKK